MKTKKINLVFGKNKVELNLKVVPWYLEWLGLMFSRREKADALLFKFKEPSKISIHSFFVNYDFFAIWLDVQGKIIEIKKIKPWKFGISPSENFVKLIEIPCSKRYELICEKLVEDKRFK